MAIFTTNLILQGAPLPPDFAWTPQELYEEIFKRTKIVSPFGYTSFVIGSIKPSSNQGPWLKDGTQWWVWDDTEADYVPLDTSASVQIAWIQETEPTLFDPPIWVEVNSTTGKLVGVHVALGTSWIPTFPKSGTTSERPASPYNLQQFYDEDIGVLIWWERGAWRTVSGCPGDTKFVTWETAEEATTYNPGWEILGTGDSNDVSWRGKTIVQASKDPGATPDYSHAVSAGITQRAQGDVFGEEEHTLTEPEMPTHRHGIGAGLQVKVTIGGGAGDDGNAYNYTPFLDSGGDEPHNNVQPGLALWCIRKT
jgi:hypothetical protein